MTAFRSLLELCRPPAGYAFAGGVWVTHDVDADGLARHVLPALCDANHSDVRRQILAGRKLAAQLTVLADHRRIHGTPPVEQVRVLDATGPRRFHPKATVLSFRRGQKVLVRAAVMSANLTAHGVANNWEAMAAAEGTGPGSLASAVIAALANLSEAEIGPAAIPWRSAIAALGVSSEPNDRLLTSWGAASPNFLAALGRRPQVAAATHLEIVDAGFALGGETDLVQSLRRAFPSVRDLSLLVPEHPKGGIAVFSPALLDNLREAFGPVQLSFVPRDRDARRLHAKVLRWSGPDGSGALVGSANLTSRGLLGRNLELGVTVPDDGLIGVLPMTSCGVVALPLQQSDADDDGPPWPPVEATAVYEGRTVGAISVLLSVRALGSWPRRRGDWCFFSLDERIDVAGWHQPDGSGLLCSNILTSLPEDNWTIEMHDLVRDRRRNVQVTVVGMPSPDADGDLDIEDPLPTRLTNILRYLAPLLTVPGEFVDDGSATRVGGRTIRDVLKQKDVSVVHGLAKVARLAGRSKSSDIAWAVEEMRAALDDEATLQAHGLTSGERWALSLLLGDIADDDVLGRTVGGILERLP